MPIISNRTTLSIATRTPDSDTAAAFAALKWTQVKGVRSVGDIGVTWQTVERFVVGDAQPTQVRVAASSQSVALELIRIDDAGQDALYLAAYGAETAFRIIEPDGRTHYFRGLVTAWQNGGLTAGSLAVHQVSVAMQSPLITQ